MSPIRLHLFAYQVGFGDCFLLRFVYPDDSQRHVLIDFGTMGVPKGMSQSGQLLKIANACPMHKLLTGEIRIHTDLG